MTYEEQLDEALKFLVDWNRGSYLYYLDDGKNIGENCPELNIIDERDKLIWHLKQKSVDDRLIMPIIYQLIHDGYLLGVWNPKDEQIKGNNPGQIKITFNGIMFWNNGNGGYKNATIQKNISEQTVNKNEGLMRKSTFWMAVAAIVLSLETIWKIFNWFYKIVF